MILSDLHIDRNQRPPRRNGEYVRIRDAVNSLNKVTEYCIQEGVELVVLTGDQFHGTQPSSTYREYLYNWLHDLTDNNMEVVVLLGNHDIPVHKQKRHNITDLISLNPKNITVIEDYDLLHYKDFDLACISWSLDGVIPEFNLTRKTLAVAHCTVFKEEALWEGLGKDFQIPKEYFNQFDYTVLGHIHKNNVIQEDPLICYPGSLQASTWADGDDMGFIHITDNGWEHIPYQIRPRVKLDYLPDNVDPETMYQLTMTDDEFSQQEITTAFRNSFSIDIKHNRTQSTRSTRFDGDPSEMSHDEIFKIYCETEGLDYKDLEETWLQISQE